MDMEGQAFSTSIVKIAIELVARNYHTRRKRSDYCAALLPEVRQGDKRPHRLKRRASRLHAARTACRRTRGNIHVGGTCIKAEVTPRDREICREVAPRLRQEGLYFVGLDIIGDYLTEVNVTSPTGIQEIDNLNNVCLEAQVMISSSRRLRNGNGVGLEHNEFTLDSLENNSRASVKIKFFPS